MNLKDFFRKVDDSAGAHGNTAEGGIRIMADSNITKKALASALKELLTESSFEKISVANICERCGMNRKSFYYHFKDKYDLVNWIFDTEFIALTINRTEDRWKNFEMVCEYFYENRNFYRKAFQIRGQNSLSEHLREFARPLLRSKIEATLEQKEIPQICIDFLTDGFVCSIERWLLDKDCMPPEQFVSAMKMLIQGAATEVYLEINKEK